MTCSVNSIVRCVGLIAEHLGDPAPHRLLAEARRHAAVDPHLGP